MGRIPHLNTGERRTRFGGGRIYWWCVLTMLGLLPCFSLEAQAPPQLPPGGLVQLQVPQPMVNISSTVTATAQFDPPVVGAGQRTYYRVDVESTESAIQWPDQIPAPPGCVTTKKASGQVTELVGNQYHPVASFVYEVEAPKPGHFTVPSFSVNVEGVPVTVPAASLDVMPAGSVSEAARTLRLEIAETNIFLGQPFHVRVILPAGPNNEIEALREIELDGNGLMVDKTESRQAIEPVEVDGKLKTSFVAELVVTPITTGPIEFSAQGFTAGREFTPPISIRGQVILSGGPPRYVLLVSDPVAINVRPLPVDGQLPGFTGAIGRFFYDPPRLSSNRVRVGEPVRLMLRFHGEGNLSRFVAPMAPVSRNWDIIADPPPATSFTLIPLTDDVNFTPPIPFSYFDPYTGSYEDLTIPSQPITVAGTGLPTQMPVLDDQGHAEEPLKLSALATAPGPTVASLTPLQLRGWFAAAQLLPLFGFAALWQWDRRRRYLRTHPEIVRRRQARRALRREKRQLRQTVAAGDTAGFVQHAARAMSIAVAPHLPANPRALVSSDVLEQLNGAGQNAEMTETVKKIFTAANGQFAMTKEAQPEMLALAPEVEKVLSRLEEKL